MLVLKILHFLALAVGLGGGIASAVVGIIGGSKDPVLSGAIQGRIGWLSFFAILVLWATGLGMLWAGAGSGALGLWFWLKIAAVVLLTALAIQMRLAARTPGPHLAPLAHRLGPQMTGAATLAVIFAVLAFG